MRPRLSITLPLLFLLVVGTTPLSGALLFDNGSLDEPGMTSGFVFNSGSQEVIDNFTLSSAATITEIRWAQHDIGTYSNSIVSIYAGSSPTSSTPLFTTTVAATRTANATPLFFGFSGFDYIVSGLSVALPAGGYSLGIRSGAGLTSGWDESLGSAQTIPGSFFNNVVTPAFPDNPRSEDQLFQIFGDAATVVPEPTSGLLLLVGALGTTLMHRRRRQSLLR